MNKDTGKVSIGNILSDAVGLFGSLAKCSISFIITVLLCVADYINIFSILDTLYSDESNTGIIISTITIVLFLDFSMYLAGSEVKKLFCRNDLSTREIILSIVVITASIGLFVGVFIPTFRLRFALRDISFTIDSGISELVNKGVQAAAETVNKVIPNTVNAAEINRLAAIITGSMPAFTSVLSFLSCLRFSDPVANEKTKRQCQLLLQRYRVYVTECALEKLRREIDTQKTLPKQYAEAVKLEHERYSRHVESLRDAEKAGLIAQYTAASELYRDDQNTVTNLSKAAKAVRVEDMGSRTAPLPPALAQQIRDAEALFRTRHDSSSDDTPDDRSDNMSEAPTAHSPEDLSDNTPETPSEYSPEDLSDHLSDDGSADPSETSDLLTPVSHKAPNAFVASWLQNAVNE